MRGPGNRLQLITTRTLPRFNPPPTALTLDTVTRPHENGGLQTDESAAYFTIQSKLTSVCRPVELPTQDILDWLSFQKSFTDLLLLVGF
jgi:hypothetical protein